MSDIHDSRASENIVTFDMTCLRLFLMFTTRISFISALDVTSKSWPGVLHMADMQLMLLET